MRPVQRLLPFSSHRVGLLCKRALGASIGLKQCRHIQYFKPKVARDRNRPLRSVLFTPGSRLSALKKAATSAADVLAFDLEDAVAFDKKAEARQLVKEVIDSTDFGKRYVTVRVNMLGSAWWTDDLAVMATCPRVDAIIIPKVNNADTLITVNELLARYGAHEKMAIWAMIETPAAVISIKEIAAASHVVPRLEALVMGTSDLTNDLHALHTLDRTPLIYSLSKCVVAARAFKLRVIDGVFLSLNDPEGLEQVCAQGRALGFDGKSLIHPRTVETANKFFGPRPEEVEFSKRVLAAWSEAQAKGLGVAVVDGKLVEILHVDEAKRTLELKKNLDALETSHHAQQAAASASAPSSSSS